MAVKLSIATKQSIVQYRKTHNKTETAKKFGCSIRTIGRVEDEMSSTKVSKARKPVNKTVNVINTQNVLRVLKTKAQAVSKKPVEIVKVIQVAKAEPVVPTVLDWTMGSNYINIIENGQTFVANSTHANFAKAKQAIFDGNVELALSLINIKRGIEKYAQGKIRIENEEVYYGDIKFDTGLTKRIITSMADGKDFKFLVNFFENLMLNPSRRAVYELFGFLEHNDIELTEDGCFLAWKRVNSNYTDMYTGKINNGLGKIVSVSRNLVDEDSKVTCSHGLHVAAKSYLPHYGGGRGIIIQCKVNPRDVVAIPEDYNNSKMRCCSYEVMKNVTKGFSHY